MTAPMLPLVGQRVLLVEDDYLIAMDLAHELQSRGAQVIGPVASVNEALQLIGSTDRIDSAVLDTNLKGEMVFPIVDVLMEQDVPFLFLTGYDQVSLPAHYVDVAHYTKPVSPAEVMDTLAQIALKAD